jgi:chitodextrinase
VWIARALSVLVLPAVLALAGTEPSLPAPDLLLASTTDPAPPQTVTVIGVDRALDISWTTPPEAFISGYQVEVRLGAVVVGSASPTTTSTTVGGLVNGQTYVVTVKTVTSFFGTYVGTNGTSVDGKPEDSVAPAAPTGVTAVPSDSRVVVSWVANTADYDVVGYRVLRNGVDVSTLLSGAATGTWTDTTAVNDVTYGYTVQTYDTSENWSLPSSPAATATPTDLTPPATPTGAMVGRGDGSAGIAWDANTEPDLAHYVVLRNGVEVATVTDTDHLDVGLTNDVTYSYTVVAVDSHGNRSEPTAAMPVTPTDLTPPDAPTGLTAVRGDGQVTLSWTASPEPDLAGYRVMRDGVQVATVTGAPGYVDAGLINDTEYRYTLAAVDTHGNVSISSSPVLATPTDLGPPAAPTGLTTTPGEGQVLLTWAANAESDLASYRVFRDGVEVATVTGTTYTDTGRTNDVTYAYALEAVDAHGNRSLRTASVPGTPTDLSRPAAPTGLAAVRGEERVTLSWAANTEPDLASYRVFRDGVEIATVTGTRTYVDTGLTNDRTYGYALEAVDTHGNRSPRSAAVSATPTDLTAPATPVGLGVTRSSGQAVLSWTANTEPDLASYRVLRDGVEIATVTGTTYTDTQSNGVSRSYSLVAVDTHGNRSAASAQITSNSDVVPPAPPTGLTTTRGDGRVTLSWAANTEPDLATYRVLRNGTEIATVTARTFIDTGLTNDVTYSYTLVAVDTSGNRSAPSAAVPGTPTDLTPPAAPTGLVVAVGERQLTLTWAANTEPDLATYRVLRDAVEIATVTARTYTDTGLSNDVSYSYTLVAVDTHGNRSAPSAAATGTPRDMAPAPPTAVTAAPGDRRAVIGWTAPADIDVVAYRVLAEDGTVVATVTAPALQAAVTALTNGTSYRFTVVAVDAGGNVSVPSAPVTVVPVSARVPVEGSGETGGLAVSGDGRYAVVGTRARLEAADTNSAYELYLIDSTTGTETRIAPLPATATGATDPTNTSAPAISDDGRYVVLATTAALHPSDTNGLSDVYRFDASTRSWSLVSVPAGGQVSPTTGGTLLQPGPSVHATSPSVVVSGDGRLVLFYSARADLVAGDTNGVVDVFAKDMTSGTVTRVSTSATGANLPRAATGPALAITPDGRFALFPATSSSGPVVLYRKTLSGTGAGSIVVISTVPVAGWPTEFGVYRDAGDIAISDDGRYVALVTTAKLGTPTPTASWTTGLAYRVDTVGGAVVAMGTGQTSTWEHQVELDPTGRYGFFATTAAALPADGNGHTDHYRRDLSGGVPGALVLVTADEDGRPVAGPSGGITTAEYGRLVALSGDRVVLTTSQGLASSDTNGLRDLYAKDLVTGSVGSPLG